MGETAHNMHRRSAIQSLVFVTGLYAHYQRNMVVEGFCGWEGGGEGGWDVTVLLGGW